MLVGTDCGVPTLLRTGIDLVVKVGIETGTLGLEAACTLSGGRKLRCLGVSSRFVERAVSPRENSSSTFGMAGDIPVIAGEDTGCEGRGKMGGLIPAVCSGGSGCNSSPVFDKSPSSPSLFRL